jgi:hypothetical protein
MKAKRQVAGAAIVALGAVALAPSSALAQQNPQFAFAQPGTNLGSIGAGLSSFTLSPGQSQFTVSLWYQYQPPAGTTYNLLNLFVGFDRTTTAGVGASRLDNVFDFGSVSNFNTVGGYTQVGPPTLAGGADPAGSGSGTVRPYGVNQGLQAGDLGAGLTGTGGSPVRLFDITFNVVNPAAASNGRLTLYRSGNPADETFTTFISAVNASGDVTNVQPLLDALLDVSAIPIPETNLWPGVLAAGGLLALTAGNRRRKARVRVRVQPNRSR